MNPQTEPLYLVCTWWGRIPLSESTGLTASQVREIERQAKSAGYDVTCEQVRTGVVSGFLASPARGTDPKPTSLGPALWRGLPACNWGHAPDGYATRRQLRAAGLAPGGNGPEAVLLRPRRRKPNEPLFAWLYLIENCVPKRIPSTAQLVAIAKATAARRTCCECHRDAGYVLPQVYGGKCIDCYEGKTSAKAA
jgi:hypothetical protein